MNNTQTINRNYDAIAWGAIFIWWGVTEVVKSLPAGSGAIGIGVILLGVNAARMRNGVPVSSFSTALGILALVWGGLELAGVLLNLPFEIPVFGIVLVVLGLIILWPELKRGKNQGISDGNENSTSKI
jgi:hypothetical protein